MSTLGFIALGSIILLAASVGKAVDELLKRNYQTAFLFILLVIVVGYALSEIMPNINIS